MIQSKEGKKEASTIKQGCSYGGSYDMTNLLLTDLHQQTYGYDTALYFYIRCTGTTSTANRGYSYLDKNSYVDGMDTSPGTAKYMYIEIVRQQPISVDISSGEKLTTVWPTGNFNIHLPELTGDLTQYQGSNVVNLYVVDDGSTYWDSELTNLAQASCECTEWSFNFGDCNIGGCSLEQMHMTRTCTPSACDVESYCADNHMWCEATTGSKLIDQQSSGYSSNYWEGVGQSFHVDNSFILTDVVLDLRRSGWPGDVTVSIKDDSDLNGPAIGGATFIIPIEQFSTVNKDVIFDFESFGITLNAGQDYAIVLEMNGVYGDMLVVRHSGSSDVYTDGVGKRKSGGSWADQAFGADLYFQIWGIEIAPPYGYADFIIDKNNYLWGSLTLAQFITNANQWVM